MPESSSGFTYRAFISYSHRDKTWGDWLHKVLETYRLPSRLVGTKTEAGTIPRRLHPVFRDRDELASANDLGRKVNEALRESENMVVICSPAAAASRWVNEEVLSYKRMGRAERIFCLIVGGEPNATDLPGRATEECFCPALRFKLDANGQLTSERTEPIAADARPDKDGKGNAKLKLIAGMLDVGFDALKQREQRRQLQHMTAITAIAVCVMAVTIVLAVVALVSRHRAIIAQREAVVARQAAQRRQKQAEGLVNFMLGDLNDKLQEVNRLDIMRSVDDKAMAYFQSLPNTDVNDATLAQRAKALEKIGDVRLHQGELSSALAAFLASTHISSRLAAATPTNVARQVAYSRTLAFIGMTYWEQGDTTAAQRAFETGRRVLQAVRAPMMHDPALLDQINALDDDTGHVLEARGELGAAQGVYRDEVAVQQALVRLKPDDANDLSNLGDAYNNLGKVALERGNLADAIAEYETDAAIETRLYAQHPEDNDQRETMVYTLGILGRTLALAGDIQGGMHNLQQAVDIAGGLTKADPTHLDYQDELALYSVQLARLRRLSDDQSAAVTLTTRAVAILSKLVGKDPHDSTWQSNNAEALTEQAAESLAAGKANAARSEVQQALRILDPMLTKQPNDRQTLLGTMTARLLLAEASSDPKMARSLREQALTTLQAQKSGTNDPRVLVLQIEALLALDRAAAAQPLVERLQSSGYRDLALVNALHRARISYAPNPDFHTRLLEMTAHTITASPPASGAAQP